MAGVTSTFIFGQGGVYWSNGTAALLRPGHEITWACTLEPSTRHHHRRYALMEQDSDRLLSWRPGPGPVLEVVLSVLSSPVGCAQQGQHLYVACFGNESQYGKSGFAIVDVERWEVLREVVIGIHFHSVYPMGDKEVLFADVGDPWVAPAVLGGLYLLDGENGCVQRVGPAMHARRAAPTDDFLH